MDIKCLTFNRDVIFDVEGGSFMLFSPIQGHEDQPMKKINMGVSLPFASPKEKDFEDFKLELVESPRHGFVPLDFPKITLINI